MLTDPKKNPSWQGRKRVGPRVPHGVVLQLTKLRPGSHYPTSQAPYPILLSSQSHLPSLLTPPNTQILLSVYCLNFPNFQQGKATAEGLQRPSLSVPPNQTRLPGIPLQRLPTPTHSPLLARSPPVPLLCSLFSSVLALIASRLASWGGGALSLHSPLLSPTHASSPTPKRKKSPP